MAVVEIILKIDQEEGINVDSLPILQAITCWLVFKTFYFINKFCKQKFFIYISMTLGMLNVVVYLSTCLNSLSIHLLKLSQNNFTLKPTK